MAENQVYLIKSGSNSFVEETEAVVGISGGKVGIGTTHPEADLHVTGSVKVGGDLTVDGTFTTINSNTISVDDKNIELGSTENPTDATADGGGITVKGAPDKTFNWLDATDAWTSSEHLYLANGKHFSADELRALDSDGLKLADATTSGVLIKGGKVGIHQATPAYDLDVDGSGNFTSLYVDGNTVLTGEGSIFGKWEDGTSEGEIFYTGGNVGVGTDNPEYPFHVFGNSVVDGNFIVNGESGNLNVSKFNVSGDSITLNYRGGALASDRGGLIVKDSNDASKSLEYVESSDFWLSSESVQIADGKELQTDKVRAIDAGGLSLQDDGGDGIFIEDGGNVGIKNITPSVTLDVSGSAKISADLNVVGYVEAEDLKFTTINGDSATSQNDIIAWNATNGAWEVKAASQLGLGAGGSSSEVPESIESSVTQGVTQMQVNYGPFDTVPKVSATLEIDGDGPIIPFAISGVSNSSYNVIFAQEVPNSNYSIHTVFGGYDVHWRTGDDASISYTPGSVYIDKDLTVSGDLFVQGNQTIINTTTLDVEDKNITIAKNIASTDDTMVDAGITWGNDNVVKMLYSKNKGFSFNGGNVGIGTTSPNKNLEVAGNIRATKTSVDGGDIALELNVGGNSDHPTLDIYDKDGNDGARITANGNSWLSAKGGNVGIGTTNPGKPLHIAANAHHIALEDTNGTVGSKMVGIYNNNQQLHLGRYSDDNFNDFTTDLFINATGDVGIGTTSPAKKLDVNTWGRKAPGTAIIVSGNANALTTEDMSSIISVGDTVVLANNDGTSDTSNKVFTVSSVATDSLTHDGVTYTAVTTGAASGITITINDNQVSDEITAVGTDITVSLTGDVNTRTQQDILTAFGSAAAGVTSLINITVAAAGSNLATTISSEALTGGTNSITFTPTPTFSATLHVFLLESTFNVGSGRVGIGTTNPDQILTIRPTQVAKYGVHVIKPETNDSLGGIFVETDGSSSLYLKDGDSTGISAVRVKAEGDSYFTGGNVGIGTTNPSEKLHIEGSSPSIKIKATNQSGLAEIKLQTDAGDQNDDLWSIRASNHQPADSHLLEFMSYSTGELVSALVIKSNGNVGIGTTNPGTSLDIQANSDAEIGVRVTDGTNTVSLLGRTATDAGFLTLYDGGVAGVVIQANAGAVSYIDNGGNVGIGTKNPGGKLHANYWSQVTGTVTVSAGSDAVTGTNTLFTSEFAQYDTIKINGETLYVSTINSDTSLTLTANHEGGAAGSDAYKTSKGLWVGNVTEGYSGAGTLGSMVVDYNGLSNIALTNSKNDAYTYISHNGDRFKIQNSYGTSAGKTPISLSASGGNDIFIKTDGNVGIGTTSPGSKLDLNNGTSPVDLQFTETSTAYHKLGIRKDGTLLQLGEYNNLGDTFSESFLTIDAASNGNVGIGTASPGALLHVAPKNNVDANEDPTNESYFKVLDNATSGGAQGRNGGVVYIDANYYLETSDIFSVNGRGDNKLTIKGSGNVGIGTTSPDFKLTVDNGIGNEGLKVIAGNNGDSAESVFETWNNKVNGSDPELLFKIRGDGNVGIGTTSPEANLQIGDSTAGSQWIRLSTQHGDFSIGNSSAGDPTEKYFSIYDQDVNEHRIYIKNNGNVGIGTTTPGTNRLQVMAGVNTQPLFVGSDSGSTCTMNRDTTDGHVLRFKKNGVLVGHISTNSNSLPSDRNFKRNISDLELGLDFVNKLKPSVYNYKIDDEDCPVHYGLIAQDVESALEECGVEKNSSLMLQHSPTEKEEESDYSLDYGKLVPVLTKAIQEQQTIIEQLQSQNASLESRISALES